MIFDGHKGILAALKRMFPGAGWQKCRTHFMRTALQEVSYWDQKALARDLRSAFGFEDRELCVQAAMEVARAWERRAPRVAAQNEEQFEQCLTVWEFPAAQRRRLQSTNMLERLMRELKRHTRVVGIFPNEASCDRLIGSILVEYHETWQCERNGYVSMEYVDKQKL